MPINWPSPEAITGVAREFQADPKRFIGQGILPMEATKYNMTPDHISWDILGPATGMTLAHTLGADPSLVAARVLKTKDTKPAHFKEAKRLGERDLLLTRGLGTEDRTRMAGRLVTMAIEDLSLRVDCRVEWSIWQALLGTLVLNENGVKRTIDYAIPGANKINVSDGTGEYWSHADGDPVADLMAALDLFDGTGAGRVRGYYNRSVSKLMSANANVRDLVKQSAPVLQIGSTNVGNLVMDLVGGLEAMVQYDEGYVSDAGVFTKFIPDNKLILVGSGPITERLGEFASTPSLHNGGIDGASGGKFGGIDDSRALAQSNPYVEVFAGIYGVPVLFHPDWIVILTVGV